MGDWAPLARRTLAARPEDLEILRRVVRDEPVIAFDTETSGPSLVKKKRAPNPHVQRLVGYSVATPDGQAWYVPVAHRRGLNAPVQAAREIYRALHARSVSEQTTYVWNAVFERHVAANEDVPCPAPDGANRVGLTDAMVSWWHLGLGVQLPGGKVSYKLKLMAREWLKHTDVLEFDEARQGRRWDDVDPAEEQALRYACDDAWHTLQLGELSDMWLGERDPRDWCLRVEQPFSWILWSMERWGVGLDTRRIERLLPRFQERIDELARRWLDLTDGIQIGSGKQRAQLYEDGLWSERGVDRTKTGALQTGKAAALQQLVVLRPGRRGRELAEIYLRWSALDKIRSTYGETLCNQAWQHPDGRLHSSYSHVGTRTGRLSSSSPNVQNIPVRTAFGRAIARAFVARPGWRFAACDYSQIELRVLAHLVGRGALLQAYQDGADVHQQTADMTGVERHNAKTGNFAYIYGAGPKKLARTFGTPLQVAERFIERYEAGYPEIPELREQYVEAAHELGYVSTMSGRRRYLPEIDAGGSAGWAAERKAFNTPIQGGARDLMAAGMVRYHRSLRRLGLDARVRFSGQVHDDLIVEAEEDVAERAAEIMSRDLCSVAKLLVPLQADKRLGATYADLKGG